MLLRVYLPLSRNIIYAMAIITFMGAWNNFPLAVPGGELHREHDHPHRPDPAQRHLRVRYAQNMASALIGGLPVAIPTSYSRNESHRASSPPPVSRVDYSRPAEGAPLFYGQHGPRENIHMSRNCFNNIKKTYPNGNAVIHGVIRK